jgi:hypothetical protein
MLHDARLVRWVVAGALLGGLAVACGAPEWQVQSALDPRPAVEAAFWGGEVVPEPAAPPSRVRVLAVSASGSPLAGADVRCHDVLTRTGLDGRADCDVRAGADAWPVYVRAMRGGHFGQVRAVGGGAEVRVEVRPVVHLSGTVEGELPWFDVYLVADTASGETRVRLYDGRFAIPNRPAMRTFFRVVHAPAGEADRVLGAAISELGEAVVIPTGNSGQLEFSAPLDGLSVFVDRIRRTPQVLGEKLLVELPPGEHVLVLNERGTRARHERKFTVRPGETTALGALKLE